MPVIDRSAAAPATPTPPAAAQPAANTTAAAAIAAGETIGHGTIRLREPGAS